MEASRSSSVGENNTPLLSARVSKFFDTVVEADIPAEYVAFKESAKNVVQAKEKYLELLETTISYISEKLIINLPTVEARDYSLTALQANLEVLNIDTAPLKELIEQEKNYQASTLILEHNLQALNNFLIENQVLAKEPLHNKIKEVMAMLEQKSSERKAKYEVLQKELEYKSDEVARHVNVKTARYPESPPSLKKSLSFNVISNTLKPALKRHVTLGIGNASELNTIITSVDSDIVAPQASVKRSVTFAL